MRHLPLMARNFCLCWYRFERPERYLGCVAGCRQPSVYLEGKCGDEQRWTPIFVAEVVSRITQDYSLVIVDQWGLLHRRDEEGGLTFGLGC